jgi:hypothetical protein
MKALVLLLASCGMRIGAVSELNIKHLTKVDKYGLYKVRVYAGYTKWGLGGYLIYDASAQRYTLPVEHALALVNENSPAYAAGGFRL